jgi:hypothetical protein
MKKIKEISAVKVEGGTRLRFEDGEGAGKEITFFHEGGGMNPDDVAAGLGYIARSLKTAA